MRVSRPNPESSRCSSAEKPSGAQRLRLVQDGLQPLEQGLLAFHQRPIANDLLLLLDQPRLAPLDGQQVVQQEFGLHGRQVARRVD